MIIPAGYPELIKKERELARRQTLPDMAWTPLPDPPAPAGINQFPSTPRAQVIARKNLGSKSWYRDGFEFRARNVSALVTGVWNNLVNGTATLSAPFNHKLSYTVGATQASTFGIGLSITAGSDASGARFGATVSATFEHSETIEESRTATNSFSLQASPAAPTVTACWWQPCFKYELFYEGVEARLIAFPPRPSDWSWGELRGDLVSFTCRVPEVGGRQFTTSLLARYKMGLAKNTYVTTQYPPAA
jgi:hypothetical protein